MAASRPDPVRACLLGALEALRGGGDTFAVGLELARRAMGVERAVWLCPEGLSGTVLCDLRAPRSWAELPDSVPGRWLTRTTPGRVLLLTPSQLARDPRARAQGLAWALVARSAQTGASLWLEANEAMNLRRAPVRELLDALDHLHGLAATRAAEEGTERLLRMGERAGGVAHDLRNQLNLARLFCKRFEEVGGANVRELETALEDAADLCQDFLCGGGAQARQSRPLRRLLGEEAAAAARLSGRTGQVRVVAQCAAELEHFADERLLARVLRNLMLNAIAASPSGGRVSVRARHWEGSGLELSVEDQGRGMDEAELRRFLRAGESRSGTGFGTTSVLACAEELGAQVQVESQPAVGTRVRLRMAGTRALV